jgi:oxygen-independent coproporphyrinogen-3 oxidase
VKNKRTEKSQNHNQPLETWNPGIPEPFSEISSLYLHIPFCIRKCHYCDFYSVQYSEPLMRVYTDALCRELYLKSTLAQSLKTVYIGGGTPSLLPDACFMQIFSCLRDNYQLSRDAEVTVEANPGTLTQAKADLLVSLGVNRMSIGVQSFNDDELRFLGRIHTAADALGSLELIRKSGLSNYSIDLMYGIQDQSVDSWRETITQGAECMPKHISAYELTPEEGTPIFNKIRQPEEEIILEMYDHAIDSLSLHGYEQYEISNFAQSGFQCAHNLTYWDRGAYIGAGAGAHSFINGLRLNTLKDIRGYIERLNSNLLPETETMRISPEEHLREFLFLGLRKTVGIAIREAERIGLDVVSAGSEMLETGHLEMRDDSLRLTRKGTVIANSVFVRLFHYLGL